MSTRTIAIAALVIAIILVIAHWELFPQGALQVHSPGTL